MRIISEWHGNRGASFTKKRVETGVISGVQLEMHSGRASADALPNFRGLSIIFLVLGLESTK